MMKAILQTLRQDDQDPDCSTEDDTDEEQFLSVWVEGGRRNQWILKQFKTLQDSPVRERN